MSAETITTAIFLITAVVATAVLVNAIYPVIYSTAGTFQSSTHDADTRLRTDFKIVATFAIINKADIYMKNIGSQRISLTEIKTADVFCGNRVGKLLTYEDPTDIIDPPKLDPPSSDHWTAEILPGGGDIYWDSGETLHVIATTSIGSRDAVYFQFVLPNGIWRSTEFTAS